jgi:hypothetical protein
MKINPAEILEDKLFVDTVPILEALLSAWENSGNEAMLCALDTALCVARGKETGSEVSPGSRSGQDFTFDSDKSFGSSESTDESRLSPEEIEDLMAAIKGEPPRHGHHWKEFDIDQGDELGDDSTRH